MGVVDKLLVVAWVAVLGAAASFWLSAFATTTAVDDVTSTLYP